MSIEILRPVYRLESLKDIRTEGDEGLSEEEVYMTGLVVAVPAGVHIMFTYIFLEV